MNILILGTMGVRWYEMLVYHRESFTHSFPFDSICSLVQRTHPLACFWTMGGNRTTWRNSMHTWREHAKLYKDNNPSSGLNPRPLSCEKCCTTMQRKIWCALFETVELQYYCLGIKYLINNILTTTYSDQKAKTKTGCVKKKKGNECIDSGTPIELNTESYNIFTLFYIVIASASPFPDACTVDL